jgi:DNA-binding NarL/FixJ family response regulator
LIEVNSQIRAVIVEDSVNFRDHLVLMLNEMGSVVVSGTATDLRNAIRLIDQVSPELIFLDITFEQGTGIEFLEYLRSTYRPVHVAVMTNAPSPELEKRCFALGAGWFVDKAQSFETITGICEELSQKKLQDTRAITRTTD